MTVEAAISCLRAWGETREWRGYDPYDALNSPLAPLLSGGTAFGRRLLTQAVKHCPLNLRPLLRIEREQNAMAIAAVATGYARLWASRSEEPYLWKAERWLDWLVEHAQERSTGISWGYHFDVQTRFFFYSRTSPNAIASSFALNALVEGSRLLGRRRWDEAIHDAGSFLAAELLTRDRRGSYFRYVLGSDEVIHNANVLAASALARAGGLLGDDRLIDIAAEALPTTLRAQRADGAWPYAESQDGNWVDNFHTGYVLESLAACTALDPAVRPQLVRGLEFWWDQFFLPDGTPKYFSGRAQPFDAQCYAQAVETGLALVDMTPDALERAEQVAARLVDSMLDPSGFVYFQRRRLWTNRTPFVRWSTAPSFSALCRLDLARRAAAMPAFA